jgi:hypothetical protein
MAKYTNGCDCGGSFETSYQKQHDRSNRHKNWLAAQNGHDSTVSASHVGTDVHMALPDEVHFTPTLALEPDLQAVVDATGDTMQHRAKMVRGAFSARGWPNPEHPGTVADFLIEHEIPIAPVVGIRS